MYVSIIHDIHDPAAFQARGETLGATAPAGVSPVQFFPDDSGARAVCLWTGDTVDAVRAHVDGVLGDAATQEYFAVAEQYAQGLPAPARS